MERSVCGSAIKTYPSKKNRFSSYRPSCLNIKNQVDDIFDQLVEDEVKKQPVLVPKLNVVKNPFRSTKSYQPNPVRSKVHHNTKRSLVLKNIQNIEGTSRKHRNVVHSRLKPKYKRSKKPGKENTLKCSSRLFKSDSNSDDGIPNPSVYELSPGYDVLGDYEKRRADFKKKVAELRPPPSTKLKTPKTRVIENNLPPPRISDANLNSTDNFDEVCNPKLSPLQNSQKPNETVFKKPVPFVEDSSDLFFKNSFIKKGQSRTRKKLPFLNENYNDDEYDADNSLESGDKHDISGIRRNSVVNELFNSEDEKESSNQLIEFSLVAHDDNFKPGIVSTPNFAKYRSSKFDGTPVVTHLSEKSALKEYSVSVSQKSFSHLLSPYNIPTICSPVERKNLMRRPFNRTNKLRNIDESVNISFKPNEINSVDHSRVSSSPKRSHESDNAVIVHNDRNQIDISLLSSSSSVNTSSCSDFSFSCENEPEMARFPTSTTTKETSLKVHDSLITSFRSLSLSFTEELKNASRKSRTSTPVDCDSFSTQRSNDVCRNSSCTENSCADQQRHSDTYTSSFAAMSLSSPNVSANSEKFNSQNEAEPNNSINTSLSIEEFGEKYQNCTVSSIDAFEVSHEVESHLLSEPRLANQLNDSAHELSQSSGSCAIRDIQNNSTAKTDEPSLFHNSSHSEHLEATDSSHSVNESENSKATDSSHSVGESENSEATDSSHSVNESEATEEKLNKTAESSFDDQILSLSSICNHSFNETFCGWSNDDYNTALEGKRVFENECKNLSYRSHESTNTSLQESDDSFCHVNDFPTHLPFVTTRKKKNCPLPTLNEEETEEDVNNNASVFIHTRNDPNQHLSPYSRCQPYFHTSQFLDKTVNRQSIVLTGGKKWRRSFITLKNIRDYGLQFEAVNEDFKGRCWKKNVQDLLSSQRDENRYLKEIEECSTINIGSNETIIPSVYNSTYVITEKRNRPERARFSLCVNSKQPDESGGSVTSSDNSKLSSDKSFVSFVNRSRECRIDNCELEAGDYSRSYSLSLERYNIQDHFSAKEVVLRHCKQSEPLPFEECFNDCVLLNCKKIGEGVYGEVFMLKRHRTHCSVLKIIPIEGDRLINGERQKKFEEIVSELIISIELSNLRKRNDFQTDNFAELQRCWCVFGRYPQRLIDLWNEYDSSKGSDNDSPKVFAENQLYIILELSHGGEDVESFVFNNAQQALSVFTQVTNALAVAEQAFMFEHRDLHWGNILVSKCKTKETKYIIGDCTKIVKLNGVKVTIIDYTLSRISIDDCIVFNDIGQDPDLFTAEGDFQFEVYRLMRNEVRNTWNEFVPKTNIYWLYYLLDKMIKEVRYRRSNTKIHQTNLERLEELYELVLDFDNSYELSCDAYFR